MTTLLAKPGRSYRFDIRQFDRMNAAGIFEDQKVELVAGTIYVMTDLPPHTFAVGRFHGAVRTSIEAWTSPAGAGNQARYTDVVRYSARAGESVPIDLDGRMYGQIPMVDLIAPQP